MLRRVAFLKAITAGALGALAWEVVARPGIAVGVPFFDLVRVLGTLHLPLDSPWWQWWPAGLAMHAAVGAIWAVFYAYFFWATFKWRPVVQGMVFSLGPAVLAGLIMVPRIGWMHPSVLGGQMVHPGVFAWRWGWAGPVAVVLGHVVYGVVLGWLYTSPVGHAVGKMPAVSMKREPRGGSNADGPRVAGDRFMFATGIECSYPTIRGNTWRMDQLYDTEHYRFWRRDLELVRELGIRYLRYGPPLHRTWVGREKYDWDFMDEVAAAMRELEIVPIMDLCHFGVPAWVGDFQNEEFAEGFGAYAGAFARRYPWVRFYTPVNEMYVTARRSALDGAWNEQLRNEKAFVGALRHVAKASVLAAEAILRERADAVFVNSESSEFFQACCPDERVQRIAAFENQRRFVALDLIYGHEPDENVRAYLFEHGMNAGEYSWFLSRGLSRQCVLGVDYYEWNEKLIDKEGQTESLGELFGWYVITRQYWDRYHRPLMHTETNCTDARRAPAWLWRQWHNVQLMRKSGVPVVGFTWYSLVDQVDWDRGLTEANGHVFPVGLYDLNRDARPVVQAYQQLLEMYGNEPLSIDRKTLEEVMR